MKPDHFYKALADDTRLRSLLLITQYQELCVCELTEALNETQPKISRHLAQLRKNGVLSDRRQGQWVFYQLHPELPNWAKSVLQTTLDNQILWLKDNIDQLETMGGRPKRTGTCCLTSNFHHAFETTQ
ncbi:metalloregulator ArsR/SmtB family transcription factor [Marinomonas polaris]